MFNPINQNNRKTPDLFEPQMPYAGSPPHVDTDTSKEAARRIRRHHKSLMAKIFTHFEIIDGATCWEIEQAFGMKHQTAAARIRELVLLGLVKDSGDRRKTDCGRKAIVWVIV